MPERKCGIDNKQFKDFTGKVVGRLTVLSFDSWRVQPSGQRKSKWLCKCECGNTVSVVISGGNTQSCGCIQKERTSKAKTTHGLTNSATYKSWLSMKERCLDINSKCYPKYGGSGISICTEWVNSFEKFLEDMGERPEGTTLNRIGSSHIYSKETCEWASFSIQGYDQKLRNTNSSGKTGVCWSKATNKWQSYITKDKKNIHLGFYECLEEAVKVREEAELKYYGWTKE